MNIILVHGILGFRSKFGLEYFRGVAQHLREKGFRVLAPTLDLTQGIFFRQPSGERSTQIPGLPITARKLAITSTICFSHRRFLGSRSTIRSLLEWPVYSSS
jgi:hypothetical protein